MRTNRWFAASLCSAMLACSGLWAADQPEPSNQSPPAADTDVRVDADRVDVDVYKAGTADQGQASSGQEMKPEDRQRASELEQQAKQKAQEAKDLAERAKLAASEAKQLARQVATLRGETLQEDAFASDVGARRERRAFREGSEPLKSSDIVGMEVKNMKDEDLGKVEDLVLDPSGEIRYAALSFGGWLGIGDKLFAVPWDSLQVRRQADDEDEFELVLNKDKEALKSAPGFSDDSWPNFADQTFQQEVDTFYHGEAQPSRSTTVQPESSVTPDSTNDPNVRPQSSPSETPETPSTTPESNPSETPESNPSETPESNPSETPESNPSETPESTPNTGSGRI